MENSNLFIEIVPNANRYRVYIMDDYYENHKDFTCFIEAVKFASYTYTRGNKYGSIPNCGVSIAIDRDNDNSLQIVRYFDV